MKNEGFTLVNIANNRVVVAMYPKNDEELEEAVNQLNVIAGMALSIDEVKNLVKDLNNLQAIPLPNGTFAQLLLRY